MARLGARLDADFFSQAPDALARALIGPRLRRGAVVLEITETEAYLGPEDTASHARFGPTPRTQPLWAVGGTLYVYLCYGIHHLVNVVANRENVPGAVLVRAADLVSGRSVVEARRGRPEGRGWLTGPGKVGAALGVTVGCSGQRVFEGAGTEALEGVPAEEVFVGERIGIAYAEEADQRRPLRFGRGEPWLRAQPSRMWPLGPE